MDVRLLVANTSSASKLLRLGPKTLVGRSSECNLRIASDRVSRRHCLIKVEENSVTVRDLGSSNGTQLNGKMITPQTEVEVTAGSMLVVGPLKFIVQFAAPKIELDEDTEWLPRMREFAKSAAPSGSGIESLVPSAATGMEVTKDLPAEVRRRSATSPTKQSGSADKSVSSEDDTARDIDPGRTTKPDLAELASESVLDMPQDNATSPQRRGSVADALRKQASETFLLFEEDDLEQMLGETETGSAGFSSDRETPPPDDGMDDELRKFLTES
jgi:predicted component of type VI protein secretion system